MLSGLLSISVATIAMSSALFTRRARAGWLDELDGIRGDALGDPGGEVDGAMAAFEAWANDDDDVEQPETGSDGSDEAEHTSPLATPEAPLPPAAPGPGDGHRDDRTDDPAAASSDLSSLPPPPVSSSPTPVEASPDRSAPERPQVTPAPHPVRPHEMWHPEVAGPAVPFTPERASALRGSDGPAPQPLSAEPPTDDDHDHAAPSRFRFARLRAVLPGSDEDDAQDGRSAPASDADVHSSLLSELLAPYGEEDDEAGEALDPAGPTSGPADSAGDRPVHAGPPATDAEAPTSSDSSVGPNGPSRLDHGEAPLVPTTQSILGQALIKGPVNRRTARDEEFVRRRDLSAALGAGRPAGPGSSATPEEEAGSSPRRESASTSSNVTASPAGGPDVDRAASDAVDASASVTTGDPAQPSTEDRATDGQWADAASPDGPPPGGWSTDARSTDAAPSDDRMVRSAQGDPVEASSPAGRDGAVPVDQIDGEAATASPGRAALLADADGVVELGAGGHLRFGGGEGSEVVSDEAAFEVDLAEGWCWVALDAGAPKPVIVSIPAGELAVVPGGTALTVVEPGAEVFVVIVAGEASLEHPGGRMVLRLGAMVLATPGGEPQVDVAGPEEIAADPAVAANLALDAAR